MISKFLYLSKLHKSVDMVVLLSAFCSKRSFKILYLIRMKDLQEWLKTLVEPILSQKRISTPNLNISNERVCKDVLMHFMDSWRAFICIIVLDNFHTYRWWRRSPCWQSAKLLAGLIIVIKPQTVLDLLPAAISFISLTMCIVINRRFRLFWDFANSSLLLC